ncbi:MAG: hypothetical protein D6731_00045 [Planctomycetota bacterium]|nr:MAG: hypothetical protein D6731_00045 [Planctomycetota bacterium]
MSSVRYLLVIVLVGVLSLLTVSEHVERTRLGYAIRELERERARLREEEKAALLAYEQAVVPELLVRRAAALGVAGPDELAALVGASR